MKARLDDRIGVAAVTYLLFGVTPGPGLALSLVLVFTIWIGWRWLCRKRPRRELGDELMTRSLSSLATLSGGSQLLSTRSMSGWRVSSACRLSAPSSITRPSRQRT